MSLRTDPRFTVDHDPARDQDFPFVGRYRGVWVATGASRLQTEQALFRFHNRRGNRDAYPDLAYIVRDANGRDVHATGELDTARAQADRAGNGAAVHVLDEPETDHDTFVVTDRVVYRAGGSSRDQVPDRRVIWCKTVDPDTVRPGDDIELPPTDTRDRAVVVRLTGYTGRTSPGDVGEFTAVNVLGEPVGNVRLPKGQEVTLVLDRAMREAWALNEVWNARTTLAAAGLLTPEEDLRVRDHVNYWTTAVPNDQGYYDQP